ncbi:MAG: DUF1697 domain-containing protein [Blastocatellia bacterium]|nr:DUF1697 domain-containing protein [Blastocatellia bacterium]
MSRYIAFLRAVNVGGRIVKMAALRSIFEELGYQQVSTFIASGNVIFETRSAAALTLERRIESKLREALGFDVATMLRTDAEVAAVAAYEPFEGSDEVVAGRTHVGFLSTTLSDPARIAIDGMETDFDSFHVNGREVYWRCSVKIGESKFSNVKFEKATGTKVTFRNVTTVRKLSALYPPG